MASPILGLTELASGQAIPETNVNERGRWWEFFATGGGILDRDLATPPGSPADGDAYLVAASPTGAWSGQAGKIALRISTAWAFVTAKEGMQLYVKDEDTRIIYDGAAWQTPAGSSGGVDALDDLTDVNAPAPDDGDVLTWDDGAGEWVAAPPPVSANPTESIIIACSDETTALTTGTAKVTLRMPYAFTLSAVRASVTTAPTGATLTVDINEGGASILSTKLTIDATEKTSTTAATAAVISDSALADDAEITIDIDQVGSTVAGAGLKVYLIGTRT